MTGEALSGAPARRRYRVVLTGELLPGHTMETVLPLLVNMFQTPLADLRQILESGQHPIDRRFSGDDALDMQERLERIGVRARVERMPEREVSLVLRGDKPSSIERAAGSGAQPQADQDLAEGGVQASQDAAAQRGAVGHAQERWHAAWGNMNEEERFDEPDRSAMFVGPSNDYYMPLFARFSKAKGLGDALSWNWAAVPSPFLWSLYRKLWLWGFLIGITEVAVPVLLLFFGLYGIVSEKLVYLAYIAMVGNRLFWPAVLNYLYFRHVDGMLMRLHGMAPYVADIDVATSGGTSRSGIFVGLAFSGVLTLFVWSFIDSLTTPDHHQVENRLATLPDQADLVELRGSGEEDANVEQAKEAENRWTATRRKLRALGQEVDKWMDSRVMSGQTTSLNLFKLREDMGLKSDMVTDGWGNTVQYVADNEGYRLISSGPDLLFGTADDIQYRRVMEK